MKSSEYSYNNIIKYKIDLAFTIIPLINNNKSFPNISQLDINIIRYILSIKNHYLNQLILLFYEMIQFKGNDVFLLIANNI